MHPRVSCAERMRGEVCLNDWKNVLPIFEGGRVPLLAVDGGIEEDMSLVLPQTESDLAALHM